MSSCLAEKDRRWPGGANLSKCRIKRPLKSRIGQTFLADWQEITASVAGKQTASLTVRITVHLEYSSPFRRGFRCRVW
jgi:hypothetical protein